VEKKKKDRKDKEPVKPDANGETQDSLAIKKIQLGIGQFSLGLRGEEAEEEPEKAVKPTVVEVQAKGPKYPDLNKISALAQNRGNEKEY
jgi:hypothetical protein